jgi:hypothetical protein
MTYEEREKAQEIGALRFLVSKLGGHSVTIVRDGKELLGYCIGRNTIAMCDLLDGIDEACNIDIY